MISEVELNLLGKNVIGGINHLSFYKYYFSLLLDRPMTIEETSDAIDRLNGPSDPDAMTYKDIERRIA